VLFCLAAHGQVETYEARLFPEHAGWERVGSGRADRKVKDGFFLQAIEIEGALDGYGKSVSDLAGTAAFFIEWRAETDASSSILNVSGVPVALVAGGSTGGFYHTTMTDSRVQLFRDTSTPLVFVDVASDVPHTYRLELVGDQSYSWYVDGRLEDSGSPHGTYPAEDSRITWSSRHYPAERPVQTTAWDYVRLGIIPVNGSGDYDSDGAVTLDDFYFFHECLTNVRPGINGGPESDAGPGCRFADFDADADTALADCADFQNAFGVPE
jgi:hypothetical protein